MYFEKLWFEVKTFKKLIGVGILLIMIGFTIILLSAASMSSYQFEAQPVSGTQGWAKAENLFLPPNGYFVKIVNTTAGQTIGGSYESSTRFHVYVFDEENFLKCLSGAPNYAPLSSTLNSLAACFYAVSLKGGPIYIVIHNPSNQPAFLHFCLHFYDTQSILIPNSENSVFQLLLLIGGLLSVTGLVTVILLKIREKKGG